jgi:hypothetical protein
LDLRRLFVEADELPPVGGPLDALLLAAGPDRVVIVSEGGPLLVIPRRVVDAGRPS